jgi:DNA repair protein RadC
MQILNSLDAFRYLSRLINHDIEQFWIICLNAENRIVKTQMLFQGTVDSCPVHIRDICRLVCMNNSACFIASHNHPSGNPAPSLEDIRITRNIKKASQILELRFLDHIIIGKNNYFSFADKEKWALKPTT